MTDYYKVLNVSKNATPKEIRKAFLRLALLHHPDKNKAKKSRKVFQSINNAYQILSDPVSRAEYDLKSNFHNNSFFSSSKTKQFTIKFNESDIETLNEIKKELRQNIFIGLGLEPDYKPSALSNIFDFKYIKYKCAKPFIDWLDQVNIKDLFTIDERKIYQFNDSFNEKCVIS